MTSSLMRTIKNCAPTVNVTGRENHQYSLWIMALALLVGLLTIALQLNITENGRYMPAVHGDWAMHAATTRAIFLQEDFSSSDIKTTLNEFVTYPKLTYVAASEIARSFELSPLQGLSIVVTSSLILICLLYSLRVCSVLSVKDISPSVILVFFICTFVAVNFFEFGFRNLVISNSFISQLASLAIAQLFIYISSRNQNPIYFVSLVALSAWILINIHIIGFVWCSASLIVMVLGIDRFSLKARVGLAVIGILITGAFLLTSPGVLEMIKISGTGGDLRAWNGKNISNYGFIFYASIFFYALVLAILQWRYRKKQILSIDIFRHGAGFLSLGPLIFASAITVFNKGGNWYPVAKWIYLFVPELLLITLLIFSKNTAATKSWWRSKIFISLFLITLFLIQAPFFAPKVDLQPALLAENGVSTKSEFNDRRYPGLIVDHPALNYFIAGSVLKIPRDAVTYSWMDSGAISTNPLGPEDFISVGPTIHSEEIVYFRIGSALAKRIISNRWRNFEPDHVWAGISPATLFFIAATPPRAIQLGFVPHMPKGPVSRKYTVTINDVRVAEMSANIMDWSKPIVESIDIPPSLVKIDGRVKIVIQWDPIVNNDLGFAMTSLKYN